MNKRLLYVLPVLGFGVLAFFLFRSLFAPAPDIIPSALLDRPAPAVNLPPLLDKAFTRADLAKGRVTVINMFASWCIPCREEAEPLTNLSRLYGVTLYGYAWKDAPDKAKAFLSEVGNPYSAIVVDEDGRGAVDWGVYGVPETYVVDGRGIVRLKLVGAITQNVITSTLLPAIRKAQANS